MIINHKYKYIFIGLPFSASSAISKELLENYEGEHLYHKHANIPLLLEQQPQFPLKEYFVFAVIGNPVEMCFSVYNKFLTNPYNIYTDPKYFRENGGFVSQKARKTYAAFQKKKPSFEEFLKEQYKYFPYDNNFSLNKKYLSATIKFENLEEDFNFCLKKIGITPKRPLPVYNKTRKISNSHSLSEKTKYRVFGNFIAQNELDFSDFNSINVTEFSKLKYQLFRRLRSIKIMRYDRKQMNNDFSIQDLKNER